MGYDTKFTGVLTFTPPVTVPQLAALKKMLGEDCREHSEWHATGDLYYIDLKLTDDFSGLEWDDEIEKTYHLDQLVNVVLTQMRTQWPEFGLSGILEAQGEVATDRWALVMGVDGWAHRVKRAALGQVVRCPHCEETFTLDETVQVVNKEEEHASSL